VDRTAAPARGYDRRICATSIAETEIQIKIVTAF